MIIFNIVIIPVFSQVVLVLRNWITKSVSKLLIQINFSCLMIVNYLKWLKISNRKNLM